MNAHTLYLAPGEDYKVTNDGGSKPYCVRNNRTGLVLSRHASYNNALADTNQRASQTAQLKSAASKVL